MIPLAAAGQVAKLAGGAIKGLTGIASGIIGGGKRRREQREAQKEYDIAKSQFQNLDTSNLSANMQNTMEDLTVNTQAADFAAQNQQQGIANTMGALSGAAGGSGIAALAQAMAGQQSQNMQQASSSIAQQEQRNQMATAQQAASIQQQQIAGAGAARSLESDKVSELLNMSGERLDAADQARQDATSSIVGGIGGVMGAGAGAVAMAASNASGAGANGAMFQDTAENAGDSNIKKAGGFFKSLIG